MQNSVSNFKVGLRAPNACVFCRRRKRTCDKTLPQCSACVAKLVKCDYTFKPLSVADSESFGSSTPDGNTFTKRWHNGQPLLAATNHEQRFPAAFFLDRRVFDYSHAEIPKPSMIVPIYITEYIGDPQTIAANFWDSVHWWMPIISKKRFYNYVMNPLVPKIAELPLLLASMKLVLWNPGSEVQPSMEHLALKHSILEAESAGILTLSLLQTKILLTIYELGHAIYPAAYFSIASCARYGTVLGVNRCLESNELSNAPTAVLEAEEKKRAWWAILILDRFIQLGHVTQSSCTEDPESSSYLPCDDSAFEQGSITEESFRISSPASVQMGMMARMSQATFLLGRVLRLQSRKHGMEEDDAMQAERWQLDATLRALLNLSYVEGSIRLVPVCAQTSICYSALIILHDPTSVRTDKEHFTFAMEVLKPVVDDMSWASGIMFQSRIISVADASPLLLMWAYQAITIYRRLEQRYGDAVHAPLALMEEKLRIMSRRWKVGEAYSRILEAREITKMDEHVQG